MADPYDPMRQVTNADASSPVGIWRYGPFAIRPEHSDLLGPEGASLVPAPTCEIPWKLELTRTYSDLLGPSLPTE